MAISIIDKEAGKRAKESSSKLLLKPEFIIAQFFSELRSNNNFLCSELKLKKKMLFKCVDVFE